MKAAPDAPEVDVPAVTLAAATTVRGGVLEPLIGKAARPRGFGREALSAALSGGAPVWLDMDLRDNPERWVDPWTVPGELRVDWSAIEEFGGLIGPSQSPDTARLAGAAAVVLNQLPHLNELGILRWLTRELEQQGVPPVIFPLIGFIPTTTLDDPAASNAVEGPLEFVLLRVNVAVVGQCLFTIRLPDRLCSGSRSSAETGRRMAAADFVPNLPNLTVFRHLLPPGREPTAGDLAEALGLYLSATSACVPEYVRRQLFPIEYKTRDRLTRTLGPDDEDPLKQYGNVLDLRMTLQIAEEELRRLLQRLSEVEFDRADPGCRVRQSYEGALEGMTALQQDLRLTGDGLATKLEQQRNQRLQTLIGGIGALLVLPALVATLFTDKAKLPVPDSGIGLLSMVLLMIGVAVLGWRLLGVLTSGVTWTQRLRIGGVDATRSEWLTWGGLVALVLGVLILFADIAI